MQHQCNQLLEEQNQNTSNFYEQQCLIQQRQTQLFTAAIHGMLVYLRKQDKRQDRKEHWRLSMDSLQWGIWVVNISIVACYCAFGSWQIIIPKCTALLTWYNMESYFVSATCLLKEAGMSIWYGCSHTKTNNCFHNFLFEELEN